MSGNRNGVYEFIWPDVDNQGTDPYIYIYILRPIVDSAWEDLLHLQRPNKNTTFCIDWGTLFTAAAISYDLYRPKYLWPNLYLNLLHLVVFLLCLHLTPSCCWCLGLDRVEKSLQLARFQRIPSTLVLGQG